MANEPQKWAGLLGSGADVNTIPEETPTGTGAASMKSIFPPITQVPLNAGGIAPDRADFNGLFKLLGDNIYYQQQGGVYSYSATIDYAKGSFVKHNDGLYIAVQENGPATIEKEPGEDPEYWKPIIITVDGETADENGNLKIKGIFYKFTDSTIVGAGHPSYFIADNITQNDINPDKDMASVIAIGGDALKASFSTNNYLSDCIALGSGAMAKGDVTGVHNIGIGLWALRDLTSGHRNVAVGSLAYPFLTTGYENIGLGRDVGQSITTGFRNTLVGYHMMGGYAPIDLTGELKSWVELTNNNNTAVGNRSVEQLVDAAWTTIVGNVIGGSIKKSLYNTVVGGGLLNNYGVDESINKKKLLNVNQDCSYTQTGEFITIAYNSHSATVGQYIIVSFTTGDAGINSREDQWLQVTSITQNTIVVKSPLSINANGTCHVSSIELNESNDLVFEGNIILGHRSLTNTTGRVVYNNVIGCFTAVNASNFEQCNLIGSFVANSNPTMIRHADLIGYSVCRNTNGDINNATVTGYNSCINASKVAASAIFGNNTAQTGSINNSVAIGVSGLKASGNIEKITAIGAANLTAYIDGTSITNITNSTAIGYGANVSGDNEVQLGNSATTVYAYGAVQDRSDRRDKADIRNTVLGSEFILALRPVDFKWDMRDDYIETVIEEDNEGNTTIKTVKHEKDGSKKRSRYHHGFIAQEVKEVMEAQKVDFGGYQDHSVNGGNDILTLGYEELIAPMVKTIQEQNALIQALEKRIKALEAKLK